MPVLFHGTWRADAVAMAGPPGTIDVTIGGGEFGQGFYTQDSNANALTWVQHRFPAPFLHYLVRIDAGKEARLLSPIEVADDTATGGSFVAPVQRDGELLPAYRFHFSIYLGQGEFVKDRDRKRLFSGIALTLQMERRDNLLLTFGLPWPEPFWPPHFWHHLPDVLRAENEFVVPLLQRVPRRPLLRYGGSMKHPDFEQSFVELEPREPGTLNVMLERFRISVIGCDPHSKYQKK